MKPKKQQRRELYKNMTHHKKRTLTSENITFLKELLGFKGREIVHN